MQKNKGEGDGPMSKVSDTQAEDPSLDHQNPGS